jgi:hypothetical protein
MKLALAAFLLSTPAVAGFTNPNAFGVRTTSLKMSTAAEADTKVRVSCENRVTFTFRESPGKQNA